MDQKKNDQEKWITSVGDLVGTYRQLFTIKIVEHVSIGISKSICGLLLLIPFIFILIFAGFGAAWWLGQYLQNMTIGYFSVAGIYTVILLILLAISRKVIVPAIRNLIIKKIYEED